MPSFKALSNAYGEHLPFAAFISIILLLAPIASVIEALELRPYYSTKPFFTELWRLISGHFVHAHKQKWNSSQRKRLWCDSG